MLHFALWDTNTKVLLDDKCFCKRLLHIFVNFSGDLYPIVLGQTNVSETSGMKVKYPFLFIYIMKKKQTLFIK